MPSNYSDAMLNHLRDEVDRALSMQDPAGRADVLATVIQPYAGWALRWAIEDCRSRGMSWANIAAVVGKPYQTVARQMQSGGPVYVNQAAHSDGTRNFDAQTPLRRAAASFVHHMTGLAMRDPDSVTNIELRQPMIRLHDGMCVTDNPAPLLDATAGVVNAKNAITGAVPPRAEMSEYERSVWEVLDELEACYQRDKVGIELAHEVMSNVQKTPGQGD